LAAAHQREKKSSKKLIAGKTKSPDQMEKSRDVYIRSGDSTMIKPADTHRMQTMKYPLNSIKIHTSTEVTVLPPSFDWNKKHYNMTHFYSRNKKMKLGSGKELQPSRILYIGLTKRLNDYYAPRA
jgi:hypothetical protein